MSIATASELEGLLQVGRIVGDVLAALCAAVRPGVTTRELDRLAAGLLARHAARPTPAAEYGFPGAVCISINDEAVHGVPGARVIAPGDLVKLDLTADRDDFVADAARTVVVPPAASQTVRLEACARAAFEAGLAVARPGALARHVGRAIAAEVHRHGFSVLRQLVGHGVGRQIHEPPTVPNYDEPRCRDRLEEGMVITIEPIVAAGCTDVVDADDGWTVHTAGGSLAAHFEETVVVTRRGPVIVTAARCGP
jgi:methionyl aminopeptidase